MTIICTRRLVSRFASRGLGTCSSPHRLRHRTEFSEIMRHAPPRVKVRHDRQLRPEDQRPAKERSATAGNDPPLRGRVEDTGRGSESRLSPAILFSRKLLFFKLTRLRVRTAFLAASFVIAYFLGLTYPILRAGTYFGVEYSSLLVLAAVVFGILAVRNRRGSGRAFSYSSTHPGYSSWASGLHIF